MKELHVLRTIYAVCGKELELKYALNEMIQNFQNEGFQFSIRMYQDLFHPRIFTIFYKVQSKDEHQKFVSSKLMQILLQKASQKFFDDEKTSESICEKFV